MFLQEFKYSFLQLIREKSVVFWSLLFPLVLGTMFHFAFGGLSEEETFQAISVAICGPISKELQMTLDEVGKEGADQFLDVRYADKESALTLLREKKITGILEEKEQLTLTVSASNNGVELEQTILSSFVEQYNQTFAAITEITSTHPEKLPEVLTYLTSDFTYSKEISFAGNMDEQLSYFYNLIAMNCLYASMGGIMLAVLLQANLSSLGKRRYISPVKKRISLAAQLFSSTLFYFLCNIISLLYFILILKISFGDRILPVFLGSFVGCLTGVCFGYFIGSFGRMKEDFKMGISLAITMTCCFLSGLMIGNMQVIAEQFCPLINRINPAALISNMFFSLSVYSSYDKYLQNMGTLLLMSVVFFVLGICMTRRQKI